MTGPAESTLSHLATALRYVEHGLPIVQLHNKRNDRCTCGREDCKRPGRHPRTENDIVHPTTDAAIIRENWTQRPNAASAVATGAPDIIAVMITTTERPDPIHTDRCRERVDVWRVMEREHGLPRTVMFRRGDRDVLLFKTPPGIVPDGKLQLADGVTIFGKGRYVRLPGSFDPEAKDRFDPGCAVGEVDVAPAPQWLARMIRLRAGGDREARNPSFERFLIPFDSISVAAGVPCKAEKVTLMAESMRITGIRKPLTVRLLSAWSFALLSDPHELAAMKSLGIECCECTVLPFDETDGRLWQIAELLRRPDLSLLDWAELVMEWVRLVREKGARVGHRRRSAGA
jgi:Bifunctional DNA primase/polymerase, N-terminal